MVMDGDGDGRTEVYFLDCVRNFVVRLDGPTGAVAWVEPQPSYFGYLGLIAADLEGDGVHDLIVTGKSTLVARMSLSGETLWGTQLGGRGIFFPPAVADLNGDGAQEVVVGVRGHSPDERRTGLYVVDPSSGEILSAVAQEDGGIHAPLVADLDRDGRLEVVAGERHLTAWEFPFEGGAIAAGHMWGGDELPVSRQPSEARPPGEEGVLVGSIPPPHYGYNVLDLDSPDARPGDYAEVSVLGPGGERWGRLHTLRAGDPPALRYPVRQPGDHRVEVRLLDGAGRVKSWQRRTVKVEDLLGPVIRQVESAAGQARKVAGALADGHSRGGALRPAPGRRDPGGPGRAEGPGERAGVVHLAGSTRPWPTGSGCC